jgi:hypothetical protein
MTITTVNSSTFIADIVNLIRDKLKTNISAVSNRVFTSYPRSNVVYPMITIVDTGTRQEKRMGMQSEGTALRVGIEIRVWARNVKERDELFDSVYDYLRTDQFGTSSLTGANLHDFSMDSVVNISEEDIKSKVIQLKFLFIAE